MMPLSAFLALPAGDRRLLLSALATLAGIRLALRVVPVERLRRRVACGRPHARSAERIAWAVHAASRRLPGTTCLASALAAQRLLARDGHDCQLTIGVARNERGFAAHAWVVCDGVTLVGGEESVGYTPLLAWSSDASARQPDSIVRDRS